MRLRAEAEEVAAREVVPVRAGVPGVGPRPVVALRRHQDEDADDEGDPQAHEALAHVLPVAALAQRQAARGAGQEEEQLHLPGRDEVQQVGHRRRKTSGLHVPQLAGVVDAQRVEREEEEDSQHAQPVDVVPARMIRSRAGASSVPGPRLQSPHVHDSPPAPRPFRNLVASGPRTSVGCGVQGRSWRRRLGSNP